MNVTADLLRSLGTNRKDFEARCDMIAALVQRSDKAALEAICRIYDRQTADEKQVNLTKHDNGIGFQQCDAKFGGFITRLYRAGHRPYEARMARVRRMAVKYRAQLAVLSFLKDMARTAPKSAITLEVGLRNGLEVRNVDRAKATFAGDVYANEYPHRCTQGGCDVRGCCCSCGM